MRKKLLTDVSDKAFNDLKDKKVYSTWHGQDMVYDWIMKELITDEFSWLRNCDMARNNKEFKFKVNNSILLTVVIDVQAMPQSVPFEMRFSKIEIYSTNNEMYNIDSIRGYVAKLCSARLRALDDRIDLMLDKLTPYGVNLKQAREISAAISELNYSRSCYHRAEDRGLL